MIAISANDKDNYGCPFCGCNTALLGHIYGSGTFPVYCIECKKDYVILDGVYQSTFGFETNKKDENGKTIYEYPKLTSHPRKGIPSHEYVPKDVRPQYGDYCSPRGVGYDLACFVKTKMAGERITTMVNEYNEQGISCWLDYRPHEPNWIQVKFSTKEKIREYFLDGKLRENDNIITKELVEEVVTMPINYTNTNKYDRGFSLASWYYLKEAMEDYNSVMNNKIRVNNSYNDHIKDNPMDFYQGLGLFLVIDILKNNDEYNNCSLLSSYLDGLNDVNSHDTYAKGTKNGIANLIELYNKEFNTSIPCDGKQQYNIFKDYDWNDYASITKDVEDIECLLRKLDYSDLIKLLNLKNHESEQELNRMLKNIKEEIDIKNIYPLFTLFGLLSTLEKRNKTIEESATVNQYKAMRNLEKLSRVASINIDNNPYQLIFDMIKEKVDKYKKIEEKEKQKIITQNIVE